MKILLIPQRLELAQEQIDFNHGFGYLLSVIRQAGHQAELLDTDPVLFDRQSVEKRIRETECDIIGIGGLSPGFRSIEWLFERVRKLRPGIPIVLGGGVLTSVPLLMFNHLRPEYGVIGEGEVTIVELLNAIQGGSPPLPIPGVIVNGSEPSPRKPIKDLDSLPFPAWNDFNVEAIIQRVSKDYRRFSILASRSCPFSCTFCFHTIGKKYRRRSPESVVAEMKELIKRYQIDFFRFSDDLFAYGDWIRQFSELVISEKLNVRWECNGKPGYTNFEALPLMKQAGCSGVGHGFETGSNKMLKVMRKRTTVEAAKETIAAFRAAKIDATGAFIIGTPGETKETVQETIDFIKEMELPVTWFGYMTPYPGTQIYHEAVKKGLIKDEIQFCRDVWNTQNLLINLTNMPDTELIKLKEDALDEIYNHLLDIGEADFEFAKLCDENSSWISTHCHYCDSREIQKYLIVSMYDNVISCSHCHRKRLIEPHYIPHMQKRIQKFVSAISKIKGSVLITPVGEHSKHTMSYIYGLDIIGFLDGNKPRTSYDFLGYPVYHRTKQLIEDLGSDCILYTGAGNLKDVIIKDLLNCGVEENKIISLI